MQAYDNVFSPASADAQLVLADLANDSGFFRFSGPGLSPDQRAFDEGKRALFGRIYAHTGMTAEQRRALQEAAREEARADSEG